MPQCLCGPSRGGHSGLGDLEGQQVQVEAVVWERKRKGRAAPAPPPPTPHTYPLGNLPTLVGGAALPHSILSHKCGLWDPVQPIPPGNFLGRDGRTPEAGNLTQAEDSREVRGSPNHWGCQ